MLLKSADDKSKRLALLEELQRSQVLDSTQKKWLRDELMRLKKGIQGERESAHYKSPPSAGFFTPISHAAREKVNSSSSLSTDDQ